MAMNDDFFFSAHDVYQKDDALIEASWRGHKDIVRELLLAGADPMLESCWTDDEYHTAIKAANSHRFKTDKNKSAFPIIIEMLTTVNKLWKDLNPKCHESSHFQKVRENKNKPSTKDLKCIINQISNKNI